METDGTLRNSGFIGWALTVALALTVTACAETPSGEASTPSTQTPATETIDTFAEDTDSPGGFLPGAGSGEFARRNYAVDLSGVCPDPLVIQKDWLAQIEHAPLYQLIGDAGEASEGRYSGPLGSTGINLVILEGGAGLGLGDGERSFSALYTGNSKADLVPHLSFVGTDDAITFSAQFPVIAVAAHLEKTPQVIFWDPETYPDGFHTVDDLIEFAETDEGKIYVGSISRQYGKFLVDSGVPTDVFVEGYAGDGENFVSSNGTWLNQGFATNEIYDFENGRGWGKPLDYVFVADLGYDYYADALSVAGERVEELRPCLARFIPLFQQAILDYLENHVPINEIIADFNENGYAADFWKTPIDLSNAGTVKALTEGIMGNGSNETIGDIEPSRVERLLEVMRPDLDERARADIQPEHVYTNEFIDMSIGQ